MCAKRRRRKRQKCLKTGFDMNPNVFIGIIADVQQCFCSLVVHKEAEKVFGRGGGRLPSFILS